MEVYNKLVKKWSSSSIFFNESKLGADIVKNFHLNLFDIRLKKIPDYNGSISVFIGFVEMYFVIDGNMTSNYFDLDYNFYNIDALLELVVNGVDVELPNFRDLVLSKSRENKINVILKN